MRVLVALIWLLSLTASYASPCVDEVITRGGVHHHDHQTPHKQQEDHSKHKHCSPFCLCACCGVTFLSLMDLKNDIEKRSNLSIRKPIFVPRKIGKLTSFYLRLLDPPRI